MINFENISPVYARLLFIEFSSAFITILSAKFFSKLLSMVDEDRKPYTDASN